MKTHSEESVIEVVTMGPWVSRLFEGIVVNGRYYEKGEARRATEATIRRAYWRARRAIRSNSYSLQDSPLRQYTENGKAIYHHDLKEGDK